MVHRRQLNGEELTLGNQGALYGGALTLWDHGTGTVWSQITGEAIVGPLTGARLELVPSVLTDWATWRQTHPNTLGLDADGGSAGFNVDDTYIVVEFADDVLGVPVEQLRDVGVVNVTLSGVPVAVVAQEAPGGWWGVYSRQLGQRIVTLELDGQYLIERDGPGRWFVRGKTR